MSTHKPGIHEAFLVTRTLKLKGLEDRSITDIETDIASIRGVDCISLNQNRRLLRVAYDASVTSIDRILDQLSIHGINIDNGWWNRFKLGWDRQIDQNVRDNAKHVPHCCSKPPPGH